MEKGISTLREQAGVLRNLATWSIDGHNFGIRSKLLVLAQQCEDLAEEYEEVLTKDDTVPSDDD